MADELVDQSMAFLEHFMTPGMMGISEFLGMTFVGFVLSLVISAFTQGEKAETEF